MHYAAGKVIPKQFSAVLINDSVARITILNLISQVLLQDPSGEIDG
jgi:hypothetical protein